MCTRTMNITERAAEPVYPSDRPAIGTYEEALAYIGRTSMPYAAEVAVSEGSVKMFCAMIQDPNPAYWDRGVANRVFGGPVAPPARSAPQRSSRTTAPTSSYLYR